MSILSKNVAALVIDHCIRHDYALELHKGTGLGGIKRILNSRIIGPISDCVDALSDALEGRGGWSRMEFKVDQPGCFFSINFEYFQQAPMVEDVEALLYIVYTHLGPTSFNAEHEEEAWE